MHLSKRLYSLFHFFLSQPHSFATVFIFSQVISLKHFTLCLANLHSSFPVLSFAAANFPFFGPSFVNLTLLSCPFFLVFNSLHFSLTYSDPPSHTCTEYCTQYLSAFHQVVAETLSLILLFSFLVRTPFEIGVSKPPSLTALTFPEHTESLSCLPSVGKKVSSKVVTPLIVGDSAGTDETLYQCAQCCHQNKSTSTIILSRALWLLKEPKGN